ncbi:basic amino acid ABC transporter substrate-binding protein [Candidatus Bipolaricaulota bacterium]|nr:basic amino acid ABC transporter substrate-binding protein [Candidatus Bipolaricaulota bacterium]
MKNVNLKYFTTLLVVLALSFGLTVAVGFGQDSEDLTVGTSAGFPPFEIMEKGELEGFDVDLMEAIAEEQGFDLKWQDLSFASLIPALDAGKVDVVAAAMTINAERDKKVDFSDPYWSADQAVIVREESDLNVVEALRGDHKVGAQTGTTGASWVKEELIEKEIIGEAVLRHYDTYVMAVRDMVNKNIDSVVVDTPVAETFTERQPVKVIARLVTGENYGLAVKEGNSELVAELNTGLEKIRSSGKYDDLVEKWFE